MILIKLQREYVTKISDADSDLLRWTWFAVSNADGYTYTYRNIYVDGKYIMVGLHRTIGERIYGSPIPNKFVVDHINHDTFDNTRENLRVVSQQENSMNRALHINNTSGHVGVTWVKRDNKWMAYMNVQGKKKNLGYFINLEDAVNARQAAFEKHYGHLIKAS